LAEWTDDEHAALADLGYEGEQAALTTPIKKTTDAPPTDDERTVNLLHAAIRAVSWQQLIRPTRPVPAPPTTSAGRTPWARTSPRPESWSS
jgi:hypothetical protein